MLVKLADIDLIDDKEGKPVGIQSRIGRRPIAAFGNSDGDLQRADKLQQFSVGWDEAMSRGWTVVSMKQDWNTVFVPPAGQK